MIPQLDNAGRRYQTSWLFHFLQDPTQIRRHIGQARMPNFHLQKNEALALALFLSAQTSVQEDWLPLPPELSENKLPSSSLDEVGFRAGLAKEHACLACHTVGDEGGEIAPNLLDMGYRLQPAAIMEILTDPARYNIQSTVMGALFFEKGAENYTPYFSEAPKVIREITSYLMTHGREQRKQQEQALEKAKKQFPKISANDGKAIYQALNCSGCHHHSTIPAAADAAPDLSISGLRVKKDWLKSYLAKPAALRAYGYHPGKGSRMPDFRLTSLEAADLTEYLSTLKGNVGLASRKTAIQALSAFSIAKAEQLLDDKLACLGCHQLNGQGGRIGPNLDEAGQRLQAAYIDMIIDQPDKLLPHRAMPKQLMPTAIRQLLVNYLAARQSAAKQEYPDLTGFLPKRSQDEGSTAKLYQAKCATCHGSGGHGNGFNAEFLPTKPTVHSDKNYMKRRPDDTLFDGIFAGGYILNRSHTMPAWGASLNEDEIRQLVDYIRELCDCQQPEWADGKP